MADKMLIDATHPEETRVVVVRGNRVEEFDFESANRKQLRGNIYLAKVTRVEPSLQAAFVDYGGNRHGFLAFSEIHPDYYQIPVADRQALIAQEEREQREAEEEHDRRGGRRRRHRQRGAHRNRDRDTVQSEPVAEQAAAEASSGGDVTALENVSVPPEPVSEMVDLPGPDAAPAVETGNEPFVVENTEASPELPAPSPTLVAQDQALEPVESAPEPSVAEAQPEHEGAAETHETVSAAAGESAPEPVNGGEEGEEDEDNGENGHGEDDDEVVESVGGADALEEVQERVPRIRRQYKIQEVIKRRQVMLVQVVKEERGTKGAALTSYLSVAVRYSVLMPNTARGGGISRKITSAEDRNRLKEIAQDLEVPEGMGVILRTAGANRT
jgi:ribonuclease E